jgi:glutathione S-transferase
MHAIPHMLAGRRMMVIRLGLAVCTVFGAILSLSLRSAPEADARLRFRIYYGADLARASPLLRMCAEADAACEWVTGDEVLKVVSCREGEGQHHLQGVGHGDTFAPPVLQDLSAGNDVFISQSVAAAHYLGERLGFGVGVGLLQSTKSVQYMTDLNDMQSELIGRYSDYFAQGSWARMRTWNDGGRLASWLGNIERSIRGPFYFGEALSAPDFYLVGVMGYFEVMNPAFPAVLQPFPRVRAVLAAVSRLPSWQASEAKDSPILFLPDLTSEQLAEYTRTPLE